jgi:hypothetical protein
MRPQFDGLRRWLMLTEVMRAPEPRPRADRRWLFQDRASCPGLARHPRRDPERAPHRAHHRHRLRQRRRLRADLEQEGRVIVSRSLSVEKTKITTPLPLLVAGFPANRIRPKDLENVAFGSRHLSRSIVSFSWGRKWRNVRAGARFPPN